MSTCKRIEVFDTLEDYIAYENDLEELLAAVRSGKLRPRYKRTGIKAKGLM